MTAEYHRVLVTGAGSLGLVAATYGECAWTMRVGIPQQPKPAKG